MMEDIRHRFSQPLAPHLKVDASYRLDEGYSEDTRSQDGLDSQTGMDQDGDHLLQSHIMSVNELSAVASTLGEAEKAGTFDRTVYFIGRSGMLIKPEFAYNILRTLRVSSISEVVDRLWPLFHKDPMMILPSEIMSQIFSYLTPTMLLEASRASRAWRERVLDNGLWKRKFNTEGWSLDTREISAFEKTYNQKGDTDPFVGASQGKKGKQKASARDVGRRAGNSAQHKKPQGTPTPYRIQARSIFRSPAAPQTFVGQNVSNENQQGLGDDQDMPDVGAAASASTSLFNGGSTETQQFQEFMRAKELQTKHETPTNAVHPTESPSESQDEPSTTPGSSLMWGTRGSARLNYHHIFKQKRKLEHNWDTGQYKSFQLPHRDHPEDAHTECVYTIQYSGKHLVSGSRDRTLRIWNLDTQRLVREPLQGHTGSVLCLQFDDSEEEDLIVSGSSDESVILWQFSTGRMIKRLIGAHRESVLNLKFDKRFLVTCSKDKTIKIWNRRELRPGDRDYPVKGTSGGGQCPDYIIDMNNIGAALREPYLFPDKSVLLEPYTHLMTLDLHGAAVNAIQIYKDELVSASGDRNIRIWNIHTGESATKMEAHTKGIACVQYDGMRIVSGSSDKTIRIWDPVSRTEVARLDGHANLVRTIQAAFADYPGGRKNLGKDALEVERKFQAASMAGLINPESGRKSRGTPGSRKPKDFKSVGAKIPPSGGGGRWGRIVSGSYDETIIIWKKTEDDEWVIGHKLRQEEALRAAGPPLLPRSDPQAQAHQNVNLVNHTVNVHTVTNQADPAQVPTQAAGGQVPLPSHQAPLDAAAQQSIQDALQLSITTMPAGPSNPQEVTTGSAVQLPSASNFPNHSLSRAYQQLMQGQPLGSQPPIPNQPQVAGVANPTTNIAPAGQQARPRPQGGGGNPTPQGGQPNARVFKLQFDARRIICCSQDPKIVGWDFANGDDQIMECSRFFAAPP